MHLDSFFKSCFQNLLKEDESHNVEFLPPFFLFPPSLRLHWVSLQEIIFSIIFFMFQTFLFVFGCISPFLSFGNWGFSPTEKFLFGGLSFPGGFVLIFFFYRRYYIWKHAEKNRYNTWDKSFQIKIFVIIKENAWLYYWTI